MNTTFDFDTPHYRRGTDSVKWDKCACADELPLWVADMDFQTAPAITEALIKRAQQGIFGYSFPGDDYYQSVIDWFARKHDWTIPRENILYTTGIVPATSAVIKGLTKPGDGVVVMTPVYNCFFSSIRNNDCEVVESTLKMVNGRYEIDFENLEEKLARESSKILLLCNPHNPGGRVWTHDELEKIDRLCVKHGVLILSDEIHNEIVMPGFKYTPIALVATAPYVAMISPSKSFNTAGLHIANIVSPDADIRAKIDRAININETCDVSPFGIVSVIAAYNHGEEWLDAMINYVYENYKYIEREFYDIDCLRLMKMEGSYLAWVDVTALGMKVEELCNRLRKEANVWFQAGTAYGADGEGYIRINLATSREILSEAINRFKHWLVNNV